MKKNVGRTDRILRAVLGIAFIAVGIIYSSWLIVIGGIILFTSIFSWCPIYLPFNWDTHKEIKQQNETGKSN